MTDQTHEGPWTELLNRHRHAVCEGSRTSLTPADAAIADASPALHVAVVEYLERAAEDHGITRAVDFAYKPTRTLARAANWRPERRDGIDRRRSDG